MLNIGDYFFEDRKHQWNTFIFCILCHWLKYRQGIFLYNSVYYTFEMYENCSELFSYFVMNIMNLCYLEENFSIVKWYEMQISVHDYDNFSYYYYDYNKLNIYLESTLHYGWYYKLTWFTENIVSVAPSNGGKSFFWIKWSSNFWRFLPNEKWLHMSRHIFLPYLRQEITFVCIYVCMCVPTRSQFLSNYQQTWYTGKSSKIVLNMKYVDTIGFEWLSYKILYLFLNS